VDLVVNLHFCILAKIRKSFHSDIKYVAAVAAAANVDGTFYSVCFAKYCHVGDLSELSHMALL